MIDSAEKAAPGSCRSSKGNIRCAILTRLLLPDKGLISRKNMSKQICNMEMISHHHNKSAILSFSNEYNRKFIQFYMKNEHQFTKYRVTLANGIFLLGKENDDF